MDLRGVSSAIYPAIIQGTYTKGIIKTQVLHVFVTPSIVNTHTQPMFLNPDSFVEISLKEQTDPYHMGIFGVTLRTCMCALVYTTDPRVGIPAHRD